ncbi:MAG: outer membrane protein assembly factor BamD [Kiritimatiellia bacterium]|jgi:outer membrane protein assembly factor BamD (BamD/ComL family)
MFDFFHRAPARALFPRVLCAAALSAFVAGAAMAQHRGAAAASRVSSRHDVESGLDSPHAFGADGDGLPAAKAPSLFCRPARKTPREQLGWAESLERAGELGKASKAYDTLVHSWPHAPEALDAQLGVARLADARGKSVCAFDEYRYLLVYFADRIPAAAVLDRMIHIADARLDCGKSDSALKMYAQIAAHAPQWPQSRRALLAAARICEGKKEYADAIRHCNILLARSPGSVEAAAAAHLSGRCGYRIARKQHRDDALCAKALSALSFAMREFPDEADAAATAELLRDLTARRVALQFEAAAFYDRIRRNPSAAVVSYREFARRFPGTPEAARALARAEELEAGQ